MKPILQKYILAGITLLLSSPLVMAYPLGLPITDLWAVFVEAVFGGFWLSLIGLMVIIGIILALGGVSVFSLVMYELFFLLAMIMGYGYNIITIPVFTLTVAWAVFQFSRFVNSSSY